MNNNIPIEICNLAYQCYLNSKTIHSLEAVKTFNKIQKLELMNWMLENKVNHLDMGGYYVILHRDKNGLYFTQVKQVMAKFQPEQEVTYEPINN